MTSKVFAAAYYYFYFTFPGKVNFAAER